MPHNLPLGHKRVQRQSHSPAKLRKCVPLRLTSARCWHGYACTGAGSWNLHAHVDAHEQVLVYSTSHTHTPCTGSGHAQISRGIASVEKLCILLELLCNDTATRFIPGHRSGVNSAKQSKKHGI